VKLDDRDNFKPGWKFAEHEAQGVPIRLAVGPRDVQNGNLELARRDTLEKNIIPMEGAVDHVDKLLVTIQNDLFTAAKERREKQTRFVDSYDEFKKVIEEGGFVYAHWDGTDETEAKVKEETKATIRCIPLQGDKSPGKCMVTGKESAQRVLFARSY
jgi:prolyl-tRNA synthetase